MTALEGRQLLTSYRFVPLASFNGADGSYPTGALVMDRRGDIFGTTISGGADGDGTIFEIARGAHKPRTIASFTSATGANPNGSLVIDSRGDIFGTTQAGGANGGGTVFELARGARKITALASFTLDEGGAAPLPTNLVRDAQGNLYGTTSAGLSSTGTIFELPEGSHTITTLLNFNETLGSGPGNGLAVDAQGDLFGTYFADGIDTIGPQSFLYELPHGSSTITSLANINRDSGAQPSGLALGPQGTLDGVVSQNNTIVPGMLDVGSIFQYTLDSGASTVTTLASFDGTDGANPNSSPIVNAQGDLFGTTSAGGPGYVSPLAYQGVGTVYELTPGSNAVTSLIAFNGTNGSDPNGLIAGSNGIVYGVTVVGGAHNDGTLFALVKVPTPRPRG